MSLSRRFLRFTAIFIALIAGVAIPAWARSAAILIDSAASSQCRAGSGPGQRTQAGVTLLGRGAGAGQQFSGHTFQLGP